jgi:hypothetical protein
MNRNKKAMVSAQTSNQNQSTKMQKVLRTVGALLEGPLPVTPLIANYLARSTEQQLKRQKGFDKSNRLTIQKGVGRNTGVGAAYSTSQHSSKPVIRNSSGDSVRIIHRELLGNIIGSTNFAVYKTLNVNPGLSASFPWLSTQAVGWEKYKFHKLKFCLYTRTGTNVPGSQMIIPDYDAADAAPSSEIIASAYHGVAEDAPWKDLCSTLDVARLNRELFIRTGALPAGQDIKLSDIANVYFCTIDGTAVNWSKLWVEYDVSLINQQLPSGGSALTSTFAGSATTGGLTAAAPFGTAPVQMGQIGIALGATNATIALSGLTIGTEYAVSSFSTGTVISAYSVSALAGGAAVTAFSSCINTGDTQAGCFLTFTANAAAANFVLSVTATTITASDMVVTSLVPPPIF